MRLAPEKFAEGGMRTAFRMMISEDGVEKPYVAKLFNEYSEVHCPCGLCAGRGGVCIDWSAPHRCMGTEKCHF